MKTLKDAKSFRNVSLFCLVMLILSVIVYLVGFYTKNGFDLGKFFSLCINLGVFTYAGLMSYRDYKKAKEEETKG